MINTLPESGKLILSLAIATLSWFVVPYSAPDGLLHTMLCWDIFALVLLILNWITFFKTSSQDIRQRAKIEDSSRVVIFSIVLISTFASLLAIVLLLVTRSQKQEWKALSLAVSVTGMVLSWMLVHSIYTIRYAHLYYANHPSKKDTHAGGLDFPGEEKPDFIDFAYFSFVLGMTFQVSDVQITSKSLRRLALMHGMLSFGYNTVIVALTINVVAGLSD